jgi:hypothetical protein
MADPGEVQEPAATPDPPAAPPEAFLAVPLPALAGSGNTTPITLIAGPPLQAFRELDYHVCYMLATLPRKRADDPTSTPLACMLTSAIPAAISFFGGFKLNPFSYSIDFSSLLTIGIFVGCLVWYLVKRDEQRYQKTSLQYLAMMFKMYDLRKKTHARCSMASSQVRSELQIF